MPRVVLIHAVQIAMQPIQSAFQQYWPEAELINILDESLSIERAKQEQLSQALISRIIDLSEYATSLGADAVLFTCSAFGEAIEMAAEQSAIPVLKPNQAMFLQAINISPNVGMIASFEPAVAGMEQEFNQLAKAQGKDAQITTVCVAEAKEALKQGDVDKHNQLTANAAKQLNEQPVLMLAHFSSSRALDAVKKATGKQVLSSPVSAVEMLRTVLTKTA
ncbi:arylsulfatase [Agarivorans sp. B2Z047]|uniref:aspartate/glutamate racemase family protein n=1 Tax=Agarivorans sp. B2Z047 TaxID=2652721 RepID=UPI00128E0719|nr:aspartate/glutamate racemase family protein [Agarivorans sp. B2Z047]MPW28191.1 arylsulfatase [Agarivorans sp. B2Z047]UQN43978.1 aspartate/glutamate racemase family protein [Agarivorans sp. B2Z047]